MTARKTATAASKEAAEAAQVPAQEAAQVPATEAAVKPLSLDREPVAGTVVEAATEAAQEAAGTDVEAATGTAVEAAGESSVSALKEEWTEAVKEESEAKGLKEAADLRYLNAQVVMARIAFKVASHSTIASKRYPTNVSRAAELLGMAYGTLRPYVLAGQALDREDRAGLLSAPEEIDREIVDEAIETVGGRGRRRELRQAASKDSKDSKDGDKSKGKGKGKNGSKGKGKDGSKSGSKSKTDSNDKLSLEAETLELSRQLVACIKALKESKNWAGDMAASVGAVLAEVFPVFADGE